MPKKYPVRLTPEQRQELNKLIASGTEHSRTLTHARILLKADQAEGGPNWKNAAIAEAFGIDRLTVTRVCSRFVEGGLNRALRRKQQGRHKPRKLDGAQEAHLIALVCGEAPEGRARWTLRLIAEKFVELGHVDELSYETVRRVLKRGSSSRG